MTNYAKAGIVLTSALWLSACGVVRHPGRSGTPEPPSQYADSLSTLWYYTEGMKKNLVEGDTASAARYFRLVLRSDSTHAPSWYELANLAADPAEALEYSRKANREDSTNIWYRIQLGRLLIGTGNYSDALGLYEQLVKQDPHNWLNYTMLAALYEQNRQPFTAIAVLDTAQSRLGRLEELSGYKRQLLIRVKLYDKAIDETRRLIAEYPYKPDNYAILADLYAATGRDSLARASYDAAIRIDSTDTGVLSAAASYYRRRGDDLAYFATVGRIFDSSGTEVREKLRIFREMTSDMDFYQRNYFAINNLASSLALMYPDDYSVLEAYAGHLIRTGDAGQALTLLKGWVSHNTELVEPFYAILDIEAYMQRPDSVAEYSERALRIFPRSTDLYLRQGFAQINLGQNRKAAENYRKAYRYAGSDSLRSAVLGLMGDLEHEAGRTRQCYRRYDRALRLDPDNAVVLNNYAYFLSEENRDLEKALAMSERANALSPGNATYLDTQGWILFRLGRAEEARRIIQQALSLDSRSSGELFLHYGDILDALGDDFMARVYWRRALENGADPEEIDKRLEEKGK